MLNVKCFWRAEAERTKVFSCNCELQRREWQTIVTRAPAEARSAQHTQRGNGKTKAWMDTERWRPFSVHQRAFTRASGERTEIQISHKYETNAKRIKDKSITSAQIVRDILAYDEFLRILESAVGNWGPSIGNLVCHTFYRTQVSLGSDLWVLMSVTQSKRFCRLNWCDSGWWG